MGTNYFLHSNICECCHRYDERHIGKSSMGWTFSFRGYRDEWLEPKDRIESYADWLRVLEQGEIYNEYGDAVSLDEFKELVESKRSAPHNHTIYCRTHHPTDDCWLDSEGHSFEGTEFS